MTDVITINQVIQAVKVEDKRINVVTMGTQGPPGSGGGGGSSDHGALTGLADDDHSHYHDDARGDVRYYTRPQADALLGGKADSAHTHGIADTAGLQTVLDGKAAASHAHVTGDVAGLQAALDDKAAATHAHSIGEVSGLQTVLDSKLDVAALALVPKTGQVTVDFGNASGGESDFASVSVAAAWVTNGSVILCTAAGVATPDHDAEDAALENITALAANLNAGIGFDIIARAATGAWGRYSINFMGV